MRAPRARLGRALVLGPPFGWLIALFLVPFAIVVKISLSEPALAQPPYRPVFVWTLDPQRWQAALAGLSLDNFATLLSDDLYLRAAISSLVVAFSATTLLVLLGYPIAYAMSRAPARWRPLLVALVVLPFWTSFLIRIYAWIAILKPEGWLNQFLLGFGLVRSPLAILDTNAAVMIGIVYGYLPFMILPVYAALDRLEPALLEAADDLGAGPIRAFWTVIFPLSRPGIVAGMLLCFIPIVGEFVIPDLLGGSSTLMLGRTLWSEFFSNRDWPLASAVAVVMVVILTVPVVAYRNIEARRMEARR